MSNDAQPLYQGIPGMAEMMRTGEFSDFKLVCQVLVYDENQKQCQALLEATSDPSATRRQRNPGGKASRDCLSQREHPLSGPPPCIGRP